jgi:tRNA 2-thiouridine synthesizing protein D
MNYSLNILAAPYSGQSADSAFKFAEAALSRGHNISRIFFFHEGIYNGNDLSLPPQDETNKVDRWKSMATEHSIDLVLCIASALKRGVLDKAEADRAEKNNHNSEQPFALSGLGQLIDACTISDRVITFGR